MIEEIDTNSNFSNKELPLGKRVWRIENCRKKDALNILKLSYDGGQGEVALFGNQMGELFKLCGFTETKKGVYAVDRELMQGIEFEAEVYEEADKKTGKVYKRMKDYAKVGEDVPF